MGDENLLKGGSQEPSHRVRHHPASLRSRGLGTLCQSRGSDRGTAGGDHGGVCVRRRGGQGGFGFHPRYPRGEAQGCQGQNRFYGDSRGREHHRLGRRNFQ